MPTPERFGCRRIGLNAWLSERTANGCLGDLAGLLDTDGDGDITDEVVSLGSKLLGDFSIGDDVCLRPQRKAAHKTWAAFLFSF